MKEDTLKEKDDMEMSELEDDLVIDESEENKLYELKNESTKSMSPTVSPTKNDLEVEYETNNRYFLLSIFFCSK